MTLLVVTLERLKNGGIKLLLIEITKKFHDLVQLVTLLLKKLVIGNEDATLPIVVNTVSHYPT